MDKKPCDRCGCYPCTTVDEIRCADHQKWLFDKLKPEDNYLLYHVIHREIKNETI